MSSATAGVSFAYVLILNRLFFLPLERHREWVAVNGIFSNTPRSTPAQSEVDIIRGERMKSFSVADELIKWAKLKEDGHISEQEYNDARKKLLQRD